MNADDQYDDSSNEPKPRSGHYWALPGLSRCAACYKQEANSHWRGGDGESSSSAGDSGPEVDSESEAESGSSSSCNGEDLSEIPAEHETVMPSHVSGDADDPEFGGKRDDRPEETTGTLEIQEDESRTKMLTKRAPLVKSHSLPASFSPRLTPLSLLPRPHTVISTLHLQVLSEKDDSDALCIVKQHMSEKEEEKTEEGFGVGQEGVNTLLPAQMGLPWQQRSQLTSQQHQLSYQHQQQQPQHFPPFPAQGQGFPPPLHMHPVLYPPTQHALLQTPNIHQTHLHALTPQPCWYCSRVHFPYGPHWSH